MLFIAAQGRFGEFELQHTGVHDMFTHQALDGRRQMTVLKLAKGEVDADATLKTGLLHGRQGLAHFLDDPIAQGNDQARCFAGRDKTVGRLQPALGVAPAD